MTGDQSLHQAALLVKGAELNLRRMFDDIGPLLRDFQARIDAVEAASGDCSDEEYDRIADESGFAPLVNNLYALARLAEWIEDRRWQEREVA